MKRIAINRIYVIAEGRHGWTVSQSGQRICTVATEAEARAVVNELTHPARLTSLALGAL